MPSRMKLGKAKLKNRLLDNPNNKRYVHGRQAEQGNSTQK